MLARTVKCYQDQLKMQPQEPTTTIQSGSIQQSLQNAARTTSICCIHLNYIHWKIHPHTVSEVVKWTNITMHKQQIAYANTFPWGPFIVISTIPRAPTTILKSISHPPFAKRYNIVCFIYWIMANVKNFIVLKGCVVSVIFSSSCWCISRSPAKKKILIISLNEHVSAFESQVQN